MSIDQFDDDKAAYSSWSTTRSYTAYSITGLPVTVDAGSMLK
jgi:hypothetical protein